MEITALIGKSGTGKSHHAIRLMQREKLQAIIDDGLLIIGNKVAAGHSAKRELTKVASVKRALFYDPTHAAEVSSALEYHKISKLLILGTSINMADRIASTLGLDKISRYIKIEEISAPEDIKKAQTLRITEGKHIIPVPSVEIKKDFSGYFLHPLKTLRNSYGNKEIISDKTVIRPTYSYLGRYTISDNALRQLIIFEAEKHELVNRIYSVTVHNTSENCVISFSLSLKYGAAIPDVCSEISSAISFVIDKMTSINISEIDIYVKEITV